MLVYVLLGLRTVITATLSPENCNSLSATVLCCYNYFLDDITGQCLECRNGKIGWSCNETCPSGFYGHLCSAACECESSLCDPVTGCSSHTITGTTSTDGLNGTRLTSTKGLIDQTKIISDVNNDWHFLLVLFIDALVSTIIGGALLYFRPMINRLITSLANRSQDRESIVPQNVIPDTALYSMVTVMPSSINETSSNPEDIHVSRPNTNSFYDLGSSSGGNPTSHYNRCLQSVMDDKRYDHEDGYSRLLLRNKHSICVSILNEGSYSHMRLKEAARPNPGFAIERSKSLPGISRNNRGEAPENKRLVRLLSCS